MSFVNNNVYLLLLLLLVFICIRPWYVLRRRPNYRIRNHIRESLVGEETLKITTDRNATADGVQDS